MPANVSTALVLIVDDDALNRDFASCVLAAAGWSVATAASGAEALGRLALGPALILMDLCMDGMSGAETVAAIRQQPAGQSIPVVAFTTTRIDQPDTLRARGFDGLIAKPCTPADLVATAARWRPDGSGPDGSGEVLDRLDQVFGAERMESMVARFRDLLVEALAALDGREAEGLAHRVAGIAGTLGFAAVSSTWLALSEGEADAAARARLEARRAVATIDRRRKPQGATTLV